ncbi:MAG: L-histidine N(alpha)-methyltransferase [Flavobacteriales bacterium]|nr:L-histidine N(alpha)-methyltransferase [Flavobacteriales bacterium]MEB2340967.1 L-histidine N(alpha)-methyltransferase [Flavobacteriia bacterium]
MRQQGDIGTAGTRDLSLEREATRFREDVISGLGTSPKRLSSRYFYDAEGDRLFQKIMACEDYYVTRAEDEVLREQAPDVLQALSGGRNGLDLVELGAGDGAKTKHLLRRALQEGRTLRYRPTDISAHALRGLELALGREMPALAVCGEQGEYFELIRRGFVERGTPTAVMLLGSNIGNLPHERARVLLKGVADQMAPDDRFLVGFDRKKDPAMILRAYNDREGHTRAFNLNLLHRMNRELGMDFNPERFIHAPVYDPGSGQAKSFLVSTCQQEVHLPGQGEPFRFRAWEAVQTEMSQKYDDAMIGALAQDAGLRIAARFTDGRGLFSDVVFARRD